MTPTSRTGSPKKSPVVVVTPPLQCAFLDCTYKTTNGKLLRRHIECHSLNRLQLCRQCRFVSVYKTTMERHIKDKHSRKPKTQQPIMDPAPSVEQATSVPETAASPPSPMPDTSELQVTDQEAVLFAKIMAPVQCVFRSKDTVPMYNTQPYIAGVYYLDTSDNTVPSRCVELPLDPENVCNLPFFCMTLS